MSFNKEGLYLERSIGSAEALLAVCGGILSDLSGSPTAGTGSPLSGLHGAAKFNAGLARFSADGCMVSGFENCMRVAFLAGYVAGQLDSDAVANYCDIGDEDEPGLTL